ncbi:hypothetical protein V9K67_11110 [Paraflavisolibacter sp. H34]|uniref:hypothetical protein n=1 Tax=Huijunlia imazamoxiresistens TaxID=3127457 RepID=UPI00301B392A
MIKIIPAILLIALLSFFAGLYFPWWSLAPVAFAVALLLRPAPLWAFVSGFAGVFLLWSILAGWIDAQNDSLLSRKVAQLFSLGPSSLLLILVTALVGGLVGGFAALTGSLLLPRPPAPAREKKRLRLRTAQKADA